VGGPRRDAYSLIFFNHVPSTSSIENDFASSPDELLDAALQFDAKGGADFTGALERTQMIMTSHWSAERAPVVIFLSGSDGEDSVSDESIYAICRCAARKRRALSFHAIAFGFGGHGYSSTSLGRMAQIAWEVHIDEASDP